MNAVTDLRDLALRVAGPAIPRVAPRLRDRRPDKLCVCGRSQQLPLCDGSHESEDWSCASYGDPQRLGFLASARYQNLALKLASHYQGVVDSEDERLPEIETLVILADGTDLERVITAHRTVRAHRRVVISFGVAAELLGDHFSGSRFVTLDDTDTLHAFKRITAVLDDQQEGPARAISRPTLKSAFVSHAVADEPEVMPVVDYLQHFFHTDLFTCADSIAPGSAWQEEIDRALRAKDCFIYIVSEASRKSAFCAFEVGAASALKKPVYVISIDGSLPPVFLQHLQTVDLTRLGRRKPWLETDDLLVEELLRMLR